MAATTELKVTGLTCGHCVQHVTDELTALEPVTNVSVILEAGGTSTVTVVTNEHVDDETLREAIAEAGDYEVVDITR